MHDSDSPASRPVAVSPEEITRHIHDCFFDLPAQAEQRRQREQRERRNRFMRGYMSGTYWKKHKRLTVKLSQDEWQQLSAVASRQRAKPTTVFRQAALSRLGEPDSTAPIAADQTPSPDPVLACADRIEEAIRRIGININQSIRHIHQDHTAAFAEVRACHRLLQGLQRDVRRLLAS